MTSTLNLVGNNFSASLHSISDRVQANWKNHKVQILSGVGISAIGAALTIATIGVLAIAGSTLLIAGTAFAAYKTLSASSNVQILPCISHDEHNFFIDKDVELPDDVICSGCHDDPVDVLPFAIDDSFSDTEVVLPTPSGSRVQTTAKYATGAAAIGLGLLYAYATKQDKIVQDVVTTPSNIDLSGTFNIPESPFININKTVNDIKDTVINLPGTCNILESPFINMNKTVNDIKYTATNSPGWFQRTLDNPPATSTMIATCAATLIGITSAMWCARKINN